MVNKMNDWRLLFFIKLAALADKKRGFIFFI